MTLDILVKITGNLQEYGISEMISEKQMFPRSPRKPFLPCQSSTSLKFQQFYLIELQQKQSLTFKGQTACPSNKRQTKSVIGCWCLVLESIYLKYITPKVLQYMLLLSILLLCTLNVLGRYAKHTYIHDDQDLRLS